MPTRCSLQRLLPGRLKKSPPSLVSFLCRRGVREQWQITLALMRNSLQQARRIPFLCVIFASLPRSRNHTIQLRCYALVADSLTSLSGPVTGTLWINHLSAQTESPARPKIAFVFSGQGSQWWAMGRQLYRGERVVREMWELCDATCQQLGRSETA